MRNLPASLYLYPVVLGIALIALGVACWPGPAVIGMLTYGLAVTVYLAYLGFAAALSRHSFGRQSCCTQSYVVLSRAWFTQEMKREST